MMRADEYILISDREAAERRQRNRWMVAGAIVIWLGGFLIGYCLGGSA